MKRQTKPPFNSPQRNTPNRTHTSSNKTEPQTHAPATNNYQHKQPTNNTEHEPSQTKSQNRTINKHASVGVGSNTQAQNRKQNKEYSTQQTNCKSHLSFHSQVKTNEPDPNQNKQLAPL